MRKTIFRSVAVLGLAMFVAVPVVGQGEPSFVNRQPAEPTEFHVALFAQAAQCFGLSYDNLSIEWSVADEVYYNGSRWYSIWSTDQVVFDIRYWLDWSVVRYVAYKFFQSNYPERTTNCDLSTVVGL